MKPVYDVEDDGVALKATNEKMLLQDQRKWLQALISNYGPSKIARLTKVSPLTLCAAICNCPIKIRHYTKLNEFLTKEMVQPEPGEDPLPPQRGNP